MSLWRFLAGVSDVFFREFLPSVQEERAAFAADCLADVEAEVEVLPPWRFGPAFEGKAGDGPVAVSIDQPATGQPDYDLYMQALSIAVLLRYHSLLDPAAHQCHCLHKALSTHGHHRHLADMVINMLDDDHRVSHKFQN